MLISVQARARRSDKRTPSASVRVEYIIIIYSILGYRYMRSRALQGNLISCRTLNRATTASPAMWFI